ncbi:MAG: restriction endonuclease subunit S [Sarcina sp.]
MAKKKMTLDEKLEEAIVSEVPYKVPDNWIRTKLGYISDIKTGRKDANHGTEDGKYPFYTCASEPIKSPTYTFDGEYIILPGNGANVGMVLQHNGKFEAYQRTYTLKIKKILRKYIYYNLLFGWKAYNENKQFGSATNYIKLGNITEYEIVIPPMLEQERIVDKIESLFEKLDKAKELIEEARDDFENRKAAILDKAFRGELIDIKEDDNTILIKPNIEFEMMHSKRGFATFKDIILSKPRNGYSPKAVDYETSVRTLKLGAITKGTFDSSQYKYIDEEILDDSHLWLKKGDFLIQRANSIEYVGTSAIYNGEDNKFIYPDLIMKFNVNKKLYNDKLLWYWINSIYGKYYFTTNATGTTGNMPKINQKILLNLPIPIFSLAEQVKIVEVLDKLLNAEIKAQKLISQQNQIELIKKSILAKAFRGELGTNNPEEESAIELLKEILSGK